MRLQKSNCRYLLDAGTQCPNRKVEGTSFCEQHAQYLHADLEVYKAVTEHYRQDIREFWSRSNFYLLVEAGLLSVFVSIASQPSANARGLGLGLGLFGLAIAISWVLVSRGSTIWIRRWRSFAIEIDKVVDRHQIYAKAETFADRNPLLSSSTVTQILPVIFCLGWGLLIVFVFFQ